MKMLTLALVGICLPACVSIKSTPVITKRDTPYLYYYLNDKKDTVRFTEPRLFILEGKLKVKPVEITVEKLP